MMLEACEKTVFLGSGIETTVFKEIPCQRHSYFGRHQRETSCYMLVPEKYLKQNGTFATLFNVCWFLVNTDIWKLHEQRQKRGCLWI